MSYEYRWLASVLDDLAVIYVAAELADRDRLAAGIVAFNRRLADEPLEVGESRGGGFRVAFLPMLVVYFFVDESKRQVRVTNVSRYGR